MSIKLCDSNLCTGCGLCVEMCPHKAISFISDELGFRYPMINYANCAECGVCIKKCPILTPMKSNKRNDCYLAWAKDNQIHYDCASGGISYLLSRHFIERGGFAVGCVWDDSFNAVLKVVDKVDELDDIKGSKYVQSYIPSEVYKDITKRLKEGQLGVFIGLPCQVAAIKSFVNSNENLLYCEILCHGGCSPRYHNEHIEYIKKKERIKTMTNIKFRGGANDFCISFWNGSKIEYVKPAYSDTYFYSFCNHLLFRNSCYHCRFANADRVSDITIGDFWGIDPSFVSDKNILNGCNLVLVHSLKGETLWHKVSDAIESYERPFEEAVKGNDTLKYPTVEPYNRQEIIKKINEVGFEKAILTDYDFKTKRKVARREHFKHRVIRMLSPRIKKIIKKIIKK